MKPGLKPGLKPGIFSFVLMIVFASGYFGFGYAANRQNTAMGDDTCIDAGAATDGLPASALQSAIAGKLSGVLTGGFVGDYECHREGTREETAKTYRYQPAQDVLLRIQKITATPEIVKPDKSVNLQVTYALLTPYKNGNLMILEKRIIRYNGEPVGEMKITVLRSSGTYTSSISVRLPSTAPKGAYDCIATVQGGDLTDLAETAFYVFPLAPF